MKTSFLSTFMMLTTIVVFTHAHVNSNDIWNASHITNITSTPSDYLGSSMSYAGDINGDNIADIIIGAPNDNTSGIVYVLYGKTGGLPQDIDLSAGLDIADGFQIHAAQVSDFDTLGISVSYAGDVNDDGVDDIIVGASCTILTAGRAYVIYGQKGGNIPDIYLADGLDLSRGFEIIGVSVGDSTGDSVSFAGDFNGDGVDDVVVGAFLGAAERGAAYVIYGQAGGLKEHVNLTTLNASQGVTIIGNATASSFGVAVSSAGDINNDGVGDFIIGANAASALGREDSGIVYVIFGKQGGYSEEIDLSNPLDISQGFQIFGATSESIGDTISIAGDVNGDGITDIMIGTSYFSPTSKRLGAGAVYIIFGQADGFTQNIDLKDGLDSSQGFIIIGAKYFSSLGSSVSYIGDVNGDGLDDIMATAFASYLILISTEEVYVIYGQRTAKTIDLAKGLTSSEGFVIPSIVGDNTFGNGLGSAGDLDNNGVPDLLIRSTYPVPDYSPTTTTVHVFYLNTSSY